MEIDKQITEEAEEAGIKPCLLTAQNSDFIKGALLLQEKWVMMIVYSLLGGSISFNDLMRKGSVNTTTLTQRLCLLQRAGILNKTIHSTMPPRTSYELTEAGVSLRPILEAISQWSNIYLADFGTEGHCPVNDA